MATQAPWTPFGEYDPAQRETPNPFMPVGAALAYLSIRWRVSSVASGRVQWRPSERTYVSSVVLRAFDADGQPIVEDVALVFDPFPHDLVRITSSIA